MSNSNISPCIFSSWDDLETDFYETFRLILDEVIITFEKTEIKYEDQTPQNSPPTNHYHGHVHHTSHHISHHPHPGHTHSNSSPNYPPSTSNGKKYISYMFRLYTPYLTWYISKRYNDFLHFHRELELAGTSASTIGTAPMDDPNYIKLITFQFPTKSFFNTDDVIQERKVAFQKYLEKATKVTGITMQVVNFLELSPEMVEKYNDELTKDTKYHATLTDEILQHDNYMSSTHLPTTMKPVRLSSELCLRRESTLLNDETTKLLFSFLPEVTKTQKFKLKYATWRDGWNFATFYDKIGTLHPVILLIQSTEGHDLFGAYISTPIGPPSFQIKGNGQCSIFRLTEKPVSYHPPEDPCCLGPSPSKKTDSSPAVNPNPIPQLFSELDDADDTSPRPSSSSCIPPSESELSSIASNSTRFQYLFANINYIAIGGSSEHGSNAIRLYNDFLDCSCGPSDTYGNDTPLISNGDTRAMITPIKVGDIEIYGMVGIFS